MAINEELLGPHSDEDETCAVEALVFSVQVALQRAMNRQGVSNRDLAERLGMSPSRVSQIFSSRGPNLTLKTIARIAHNLGEDLEVLGKSDIRKPFPEIKARIFKPVSLKSGDNPNRPVWREKLANSSGPRNRDLAA